MGITRREFLRSAAVVGAGAVLGGCAPEVAETLRRAAEVTATNGPKPTAQVSREVTRAVTVTPEVGPTATKAETPVVVETPGVVERERPWGIKGVYLWGGNLVDEAAVERVTRGVEQDGANAVIIDIKDETGEPSIPFVHPWYEETEEVVAKARVLERIAEWAERNNVYLIARQVVMTDYSLSRRQPEIAYTLPDGRKWGNFMNPLQVEAVGGYNGALARAAAGFGFRELQLDYIRFPEAVFHIPLTERVGAITGIVAAIREQIREAGLVLTVDLFSDAALMPAGPVQDGGYGQDYWSLGAVCDGICPMAYPNLHSLEEGADPYTFVRQVTEASLRKIQAVNPRGFVNPWIQGYSMGREAIREQWRGALEAGAAGAMIWNGGSYFPEGVFVE